MDIEQTAPIEEWSDEEVLSQYRYVSAEFADEEELTQAGDNGPLTVLRREIERRGLSVPKSASAASPGRETTEP